MKVRAGLLAAALLPLALAACSVFGGMVPDGDPFHVLEERRLDLCHSDGPQARLTLLADPAAVRAWQERRKIELIGVDPLPSPGPFVLVELGERISSGYGIAVSREASLSDGTVRLNASLITPDPGQAVAQRVTSPCVLVALPAGSYRAAELRDPAGSLLARADSAAPVQ